MRLSRLPALVFLLLSLCAGSATAQDVYFTLHDYAPLWLNPAQTGAFSGSLRVGGIIRAQGAGLETYRSPTAFADAPVIKGLRKYDWIGVGASLVSDRGFSDFSQGSDNNAKLTSTTFGFAASYHLALDKKRRNVITLGAMYGSTNLGFEIQGVPVQELNIDSELGGQGMTGESEFEPTQENPGGPGGNRNSNTSSSYTDINAGLMLRSVLDPKKNNVLEVGVALAHLNRPEYQRLFRSETDGGPPVDTAVVNPPPVPGSLGTRERRRPRTLHFHGRLDLELSDRYRIQPSAFVQTSAGNTAFSVQAWGARRLRPQTDLRAGLGFRSTTGLELMAGLDIKQLRAAISYDLLRLSDSAVGGVTQPALELTANYIFNFFKKPQVVPTMLCPRI